MCSVMMIPSIDIMNGQAVQLIGGKQLSLNAGDPRPLAEKFGRIGEIAVIDLDAALGRGSNAELIRELIQLAPCRVGGGIRSVPSAVQWLDAGAAKIILGTAARSEVLGELPRDRVIAALDAVDGEVVDHGWTSQTGARVVERLLELRDLVGGFLITFVEREGRMTGIDGPTIQEYLAQAGEARVTIAGGIETADEIALLDRWSADAQVGMALYTDKITLADGFVSVLNSDRQDGLWPTIVANETGQALGLVYSNAESVARSLETGSAHYFSRRRGLWSKGQTSGNTQRLLKIDVDCDRDTLRFTVQQSGRGFCHRDQTTCFGDLNGISELQRRLQQRLESAPSGSYSQALFRQPELLAAKIEEEAREFCEAQTRGELIHEAADVVFFTLTRLVKENVPWWEVEAELDRRACAVRVAAAKPRIENEDLNQHDQPAT